MTQTASQPAPPAEAGAGGETPRDRQVGRSAGTGTLTPRHCADRTRVRDLNTLLAGLDLSDDEHRYLDYYRYRLERIITDLPDLNGKDVLDLGCNTGFMMALFRRLWPDVRLVGCDINRAYVAAAERRGFRTLVCDLDAAEVPLAAESFDLVFAGEIIEMLTRLDPLFRGVNRVLRPGGKVFAQTYNLGCLSNRLNLLLNRPIFLKWTRRYDSNLWRRSYLRSELEEMLRYYGFADLNIYEVGSWGPKRLRRTLGRLMAAANCSLGSMFMIEASKPD